MRTYNTAEFAGAVAAKTKTPVLVLRTDGSCASTLRYQDIPLDQAVIDELLAEDIAFVTFADPAEATAAFEQIAASYPTSTTLSLSVVLAIPGEEPQTFAKIPGVC